jgi:hypothetical protein
MSKIEQKNNMQNAYKYDHGAFITGQSTLTQGDNGPASPISCKLRQDAELRKEDTLTPEEFE